MIFSLGGCATAEPLVLVGDGAAQCVIVLPETPEKYEKLAAEELAHFLKEMSGAEIPVKTGTPATAGTLPEGEVRILLGSAAGELIGPEMLDRALGDRRDDLNCRDGFVIRTDGNVLAIRGVRHTGTLFGVYDFLERLGCRWFWPGELGEIVPRRSTVDLEPVDVVQAPTFDMRSMWFSGDHDTNEAASAWSRRNRLDLDYQYSGGHTPHPDISRPDAAEIKANEILEKLRKNPKTRWFSLSWGDTSARNIGAKALGLRHPWNKNQEHSTDALVAYYNGVVERVEKEFPGRSYGFLVYNNYFLQPLRHKPHPRLCPWFTPIEQCTRHLPGTGTCWQRDANFEILRTWCALSDRVFIYDYEPTLLIENGVPMPAVERFAVEMPLMAQYGVRGILQQSQLSVMNEGPNLYVRAQLMWNASADVEQMLQEYYTMMYGAAAPHVQRYREALAQMLYNAPGHQQHAYYFEDELLKIIYPIDRIQKLEALVSAAESAAATDLQRRRVRAVRFSFDNLMLYLHMRGAEDEGRFAEAADLADRILKLRHEIDAEDSVLYKIGDLDRNDEGDEHMQMPGGWAKFNRARAARIDGREGELVAMTPESWAFTTDPKNEGTAQHWFDPAHDTSAWQPIRTTLFWEVQGYETRDGHGYDGVAWYTTRVQVPKRFAGRPIKVNFGGVCGEVLVWVNGRFAGYQPYPRPWWYNQAKQNYDIEVTDALKVGGENEIVVRVRSDDNWGGIFRRVFLWTPKS